jgi:hypothetical protein
LYPIGKDRFYNYSSYAEVTFVRGDDGKVKRLEWDAPNGKFPWERHPLPPESK